MWLEFRGGERIDPNGLVGEMDGVWCGERVSLPPARSLPQNDFFSLEMACFGEFSELHFVRLPLPRIVMQEIWCFKF